MNAPVSGDRRNPYLLNATHQEMEFANLTLRRTLFEQCQFFAVSFANTDFLLSCLSEGRFIDCDFSDAILICANLSGVYFFGCRFVNAQLVGAEMRGANLENCDFTGADLTGARLDLHLKETLALSEIQKTRMVDWRSPDDEGPDKPPRKR
jgi:uncharacterized protein YjbI with pentapeptide repeats